jgi:hypothetical protein
VAVGKHVNSFTVINSEAERLPKLNSQRLVTLICTYGCNFGAIFDTPIFQQLR